MSTSSRQDYIHKVFERQCEIAISKILSVSMLRLAIACRRYYLRNGFRHADLRLLLREDISQPVLSLLQTNERLDSCPHHMEDLQAFLRRGLQVFSLLYRGRFDILNPVQCSATGWSRSN